MTTKVATKPEQWLVVAERVTSAIAAVTIIAIGVITIAGVIMRAAGVTGFGEIELVQILMTLPALLPLAAAQAEGHIRMTLITSRLSGRSHFWVTLVAYVLVLALTIAFVWKSAEHSIYSISIGEATAGATRWPVWLLRLSFPIGTLLLLFRIFQQIYQLRRSGR